MNADDPGLFEMVAEAPATLAKPPGRGRSRETWICTVSARAAIVDSAALDAAMAKAEADGFLLGVLPDDDSALASDEPGDRSVCGFDRVAWLLWPTDGLDQVLEVRAFDVREVIIEVAAASEVEGTVTWSIEVKLRDVPALRQIAVAAHPEQRTAINQSMVAAWQCAIDPFEPIRSVPGVTWQPGPVEIRQVPARAKRGPAGAPSA